MRGMMNPPGGFSTKPAFVRPPQTLLAGADPDRATTSSTAVDAGDAPTNGGAVITHAAGTTQGFNAAADTDAARGTAFIAAMNALVNGDTDICFYGTGNITGVGTEATALNGFSLVSNLRIHGGKWVMACDWANWQDTNGNDLGHCIFDSSGKSGIEITNFEVDFNYNVATPYCSWGLIWVPPVASTGLPDIHHCTFSNQWGDAFHNNLIEGYRGCIADGTENDDIEMSGLRFTYNKMVDVRACTVYLKWVKDCEIHFNVWEWTPGVEFLGFGLACIEVGTNVHFTGNYADGLMGDVNPTHLGSHGLEVHGAVNCLWAGNVLRTDLVFDSWHPAPIHVGLYGNKFISSANVKVYSYGCVVANNYCRSGCYSIVVKGTYHSITNNVTYKSLDDAICLMNVGHCYVGGNWAYEGGYSGIIVENDDPDVIDIDNPASPAGTYNMVEGNYVEAGGMNPYDLWITIGGTPQEGQTFSATCTRYAINSDTVLAGPNTLTFTATAAKKTVAAVADELGKVINTTGRPDAASGWYNTATADGLYYSDNAGHIRVRNASYRLVVTVAAGAGTGTIALTEYSPSAGIYLAPLTGLTGVAADDDMYAPYTTVRHNVVRQGVRRNLEHTIHGLLIEHGGVNCMVEDNDFRLSSDQVPPYTDESAGGTNTIRNNQT